MEFVQSTLETEVDKILQVAHSSFDDGFYSKARLFEKIAGKKHGVYLARDNGRVVGFKIWYEDGKNVYDWLDAVHPDYRRRGIASRLMNMEIEMASREKYEKVTLKTHEGHPEMIALCKKFGFKEVRREQHHWKDTLDREAIFFELDVVKR